MNLRSISLVLALSLFAGGAWAQGQDYQAMMMAMDQAKADSARPGDDKLSCEQLEEQLVSVTQDPDFQAHVESAGANAQKQQEAMQGAKGQIALQSLRTVLMTFIPGGRMAGMAHAQAQAKAQGVQSMSQMKSRIEQAQQMMVLMPKLMRGQRVVELAAGKNCEWAAGAGMGQ